MALVEANNSPDPEVQPAVNEIASGRPHRSAYHQRLYAALLIFVVAIGFPMVAVPSLRSTLRTKVQTLRAALMGEPVVQPPVTLKVGENPQPFPKEYEHKQAEQHLPFLPKIQTPARSPYTIVIGGDAPQAQEKAPVAAPKRKLAIPEPATPAAAEAAPPAGQTENAGSEIRYQKGKSEQEAYELLLSTNPTLAGMITGSDPALKFQDWSAANMGQDSFYVMVTFLHAPDSQARKYIWNVKVATKQVVPLSAYAREISK
jgi:hypothetical protein